MSRPRCVFSSSGVFNSYCRPYAGSTAQTVLKTDLITFEPSPRCFKRVPTESIRFVSTPSRTQSAWIRMISRRIRYAGFAERFPLFFGLPYNISMQLTAINRRTNRQWHYPITFFKWLRWRRCCDGTDNRRLPMYSRRVECTPGHTIIFVPVKYSSGHYTVKLRSNATKTCKNHWKRNKFELEQINKNCRLNYLNATSFRQLFICLHNYCIVKLA